MITLTARIDLISGNNGTLSSATTDFATNNISSDIGAILGVKTENKNPFIVGVNKVGDGSTFSSKNCGLVIGSQLSNDNGEFEPSCEITVNGSNINVLTIAFDTVNNRHPNTIKIDENEYKDDDAIFTVNLENANSHTITIDNWNANGYPLVISGIYVEINIDINYRNLIGLSAQIFDRSDYKLPSYGIISNTGNLEFNDLDGEIKDYAEQMLLSSDLKVKIDLTDTLSGISEQVALMETENWDYDNDNRSVSVSLKDDLVEWQDIYIAGINYDPSNPFATIEKGNLLKIYDYLYEKTPSKYNMISSDDLDYQTKSIIQKITMEQPILKDGTLWEQWNKFCQVCGLYIYKNSKGKTICNYTYGS